MSAYIVGKAHIDYLLSAGMSRSILGIYGPMYWFDADPDSSTYQEGEAIPVSSIQWAQGHKRELTHATAGLVGAMLALENQRSVNHRYAEEELEEPYLFAEVRGPFNPVDVLKACKGYEYQSCEHYEWRTSEAKAFIDALREHAIGQLTESSEFWSVDESMIQYETGRLLGGR